MIFTDLIGKPLGDILFEVLQFKFEITNLMVIDMQNPEIGLIFLDDIDSTDMVFNDFKFHLAFEFSVRRSILPYFEDFGTGTIDLTVDSVHSIVTATQSEECPGALNLVESQSSCHIEKLNIVFQSQKSFIYNAVMPFIQEYLIALFNDVMGSAFVG